MMTTSLDFTILETYNCNTLGVVDTSYYSDGQVISNPRIYIYLPGETNPVILGFLPRKVNIYNSNNLGLSNVTSVSDLITIPDGVYKVRYAFSTFTVEKYFLRTCLLQCKYDSVLLQLDIFDCNETSRKAKLNNLKDIEFIIMSAIASASKCNYSLAASLYDRADKELDKLLGTC